MTDKQQPVVYRRTKAPGLLHGVPKGDLTQADFDALTPGLRRDVKASPLYQAVDTAKKAAADAARAKKKDGDS